MGLEKPKYMKSVAALQLVLALTALAVSGCVGAAAVVGE